MTAFADSSAVVALYAEEPGRDHVGEVADLAVSDLARVEVASAFWTKVRMGELRPPAIVARAAALVSRHVLRAVGAIQLASALAAREADPFAVAA